MNKEKLRKKKVYTFLNNLFHYIDKLTLQINKYLNSTKSIDSNSNNKNDNKYPKFKQSGPKANEDSSLDVEFVKDFIQDLLPNLQQEAVNQPIKLISISKKQNQQNEQNKLADNYFNDDSLPLTPISPSANSHRYNTQTSEISEPKLNKPLSDSVIPRESFLTKDIKKIINHKWIYLII